YLLSGFGAAPADSVGATQAEPVVVDRVQGVSVLADDSVAISSDQRGYAFPLTLVSGREMTSYKKVERGTAAVSSSDAQDDTRSRKTSGDAAFGSDWLDAVGAALGATPRSNSGATGDEASHAPDGGGAGSNLSETSATVGGGVGGPSSPIEL